ncbi:MAG: endolytic transglycosylase MltG [Chlorobiota bacterium]
MWSRVSRWILLGIIVGGVAAAGLAAYLLQHLPVDATVECWVPHGSGVRAALATTASCCRLPLPELFVAVGTAYAIATGSRVYAGTYRFGPETRCGELLRALFSGRQVLRVRVTLPEGLTITQLASLLRREAGVDSARFVALAFSDSLAQLRGIPVPSLEGYLMPDTYELFWRHPAEEVLERLLQTQDRLWQERFAERARSRGLSRHEVLTLASIIEAESPHSDERRRISGVFWNRLRRGMPLQADPTAAYALGKPGQPLKRSELNIPHPYNTYTRLGLPPGPINNPSADAIEAALEPEEHDFLYFVLLRDGSRRHLFSRTYSEHLRAIAAQQR